MDKFKIEKLIGSGAYALCFRAIRTEDSTAKSKLINQNVQL